MFDLRLRAEREAAPDPIVPGVESVWYDVEHGYEMPGLDEYASDGGRAAWEKEHLNYALAYRPVIRAVLEHVRDRPGEPILFHCTGGFMVFVYLDLLPSLPFFSFSFSSFSFFFFSPFFLKKK